MVCCKQNRVGIIARNDSLPLDYLPLDYLPLGRHCLPRLPISPLHTFPLKPYQSQSRYGQYGIPSLHPVPPARSLAVWVLSIAKAALLLVPGADPGLASAESTSPAPKSIATRQTLFSIPFQIERGNDPGHDAVEVQLFASSDQGGHWELHSRVPPSQGRFLFRAPGDGQYWFLIRTVDKTGRVRPQYNNRPGLVVLVDTQAPVLNLEAEQGEAGQVIARWEATDPHLSFDSLRIQYRTADSPDWQTVAIDRRAVRSEGATLRSEVSWWPRIRSGRVEIRGEAADSAGNITVTNAQVDLAGSVALRAHPPVRNQFVAQAQPVVGPRLDPQPQNPPRPRLVNTRLFELEYAVQGAPSAGRVELWGTTDGGRTWSRFGTDDDGRSPMLVAVPQEGLYGFRIAAEARPGRGTQPPRPGEAPEITIGVDLSKPFVEILSAEQGGGEQAEQVAVRWKAEDRILADQPISLAYSETPGGPWRAIATNLKNTGAYTWSLDDEVPPRFFLRLEARDEAGNVGVYEMPRAVEIRLPQPSLQIRDIRPLNGSARTPPKRYYWK